MYLTSTTCSSKDYNYSNFFQLIHLWGSSSPESDMSDSVKLLETGSFLHIKCFRLCNVNKIKILSVWTTLYPAFMYMLNGASSIILQCKYTSLEQVSWDISSSLALRRCHPMPLLNHSNADTKNLISYKKAIIFKLNNLSRENIYLSTCHTNNQSTKQKMDWNSISGHSKYHRADFQTRFRKL